MGRGHSRAGARGARRRPEVVIGDRFGAAASSEVVEKIEAIFADAGLAVVRNAPFAGAYIVQTYGRPGRNQHALQIEIDTSLTSKRLIRVFERLKLERGLADTLRVDNGPEFLSGAFVAWAESNGLTIQYIQPGEPN